MFEALVRELRVACDERQDITQGSAIAIDQFLNYDFAVDPNDRNFFLFPPNF